MSRKFVLSFIAMVAMGCPLWAQSLPYGIVLKPGETLVAIDGVPYKGGAVTTSTSTSMAHSSYTSEDALDEVNRTRAQRGLRPYLRDEGLVQGALKVAQHRAQHLIAGHSSNDFAIGGVSASASGCAAWPASMGWGSCCTYENWTYAGAAYAYGRDGRRYMQLFVR
jgi:uncharacterized protein YkwD